MRLVGRLLEFLNNLRKSIFVCVRVCVCVMGYDYLSTKTHPLGTNQPLSLRTLVL